MEAVLPDIAKKLLSLDFANLVGRPQLFDDLFWGMSFSFHEESRSRLRTGDCMCLKFIVMSLTSLLSRLPRLVRP